MSEAADPFQEDPELIAMDILGREGPEVDRGYNGRSFVGQVQAVVLARAYLDAAAALRDWQNRSDSGTDESIRCPDCGCRAEDHNAVNRLVGTEDRVAHCGGCGACWKTKNGPFVELVLASLTGPATEDEPEVAVPVAEPPPEKPVTGSMSYTQNPGQSPEFSSGMRAAQQAQEETTEGKWDE